MWSKGRAGHCSLADARGEDREVARIQSDNLIPPAVVNDPILKRFRAALDELYGDRIERVVLMGSRVSIIIRNSPLFIS
jgi:hypothetical protein